jgi:hypothetical protein
MLHPTITICTYVVKTLLVYQRLVAVGSLKFLCFLSLTGIKPTQCVVLVLKRRNKQTSATICATLAVIYMLKVNLMAELSRQQMEVLAPPSYSSLFVIFLALKILTHCIHNKSSKKLVLVVYMYAQAVHETKLKFSLDITKAEV